MAIHDPELLDAIESLGSEALDAVTVWRHMFNDNPPELSNTRGARWNPAGLAAIYTSEEREVAIAEASTPSTRNRCDRQHAGTSTSCGSALRRPSGSASTTSRASASIRRISCHPTSLDANESAPMQPSWGTTR